MPHNVPERECPQCGRLKTRFHNDVCHTCNDVNRTRARRLWGKDGEPVRKRKRKHNRLRTAKLDSHQIRSAYTLYCDNRSLADVANLIWQKWGYSSPASCRSALGASFVRDGLPLRPLSMAHKVRVANGRGVFPTRTECGRCGGPVGERTRGCRACASRHSKRRMKAGLGVPRRECSRCGCYSDDRTPGCGTCRQRHSKRKSREKKSAPEGALRNVA